MVTAGGVADEKTLLIPDRRGNNRVDSLRNVITGARMALLFLIDRSRLPSGGTILAAISKG